MVRLIENEDSNNNVTVYDNLIDAFTDNYIGDFDVVLYAEQAGKPKRVANCKLSKLAFADIIAALDISGHANNIVSAKCRVTTFPNDDRIVMTII